ncbi:lactococcin family bacteriocin [Lactococcus sp.]|uniref:lactococcin family bacteriocin n=1 Tax=Lactococcus sp. TaxID=44273 RepID=UPI002FCAFC73
MYFLMILNCKKIVVFLIESEYNDVIKYKRESQVENQLNFEVVSDEELAEVSGGYLLQICLVGEDNQLLGGGA